MTVYNNLRNPVLLTVEGKDYRIEAEDQIELKLSAGEYTMNVYQLCREDGLGDAMGSYTKPAVWKRAGVPDELVAVKRYNRRAADDFILGAKLRLNVEKNSRLYLRKGNVVHSASLLDQHNRKSQSKSSSGLWQEVFEVIADGCELLSQTNGYPTADIRESQQRSHRTKALFSLLPNLIFTVVAVIVLYIGLPYLLDRAETTPVIRFLPMILAVPYTLVEIFSAYSKYRKITQLLSDTPLLEDDPYDRFEG